MDAQNIATPLSGDVVVLIDYENLHRSLLEHFEVAPDPTALMAAVRAFGRPVVARAYAPWNAYNLHRDVPPLFELGIEPVYVAPMKNSADVRMAVDALHLSHERTDDLTYIFVTGDGAFKHVAEYLRQQGRRVVVIAVRATMSRHLPAAADAVLIYERDIVALGPSPTVTCQPHAAAPSVAPSPDQVSAWIEAVLAERSGGRALHSQIGSALRERYHLDVQAMLGCTLTAVMQRAEACGRIVNGRDVNGHGYACLVRSTSAPDRTGGAGSDCPARDMEHTKPPSGALGNLIDPLASPDRTQSAA